MDWNTVQKHWPKFIAPLMQRFDIPEDRLSEIDGDRAAMVGEIVEREEVPAAEAEDRLKEWLQGPLPADVYAEMDTQAVTDSVRYIPPGEDTLADDKKFGVEDQPEAPIGRRD